MSGQTQFLNFEALNVLCFEKKIGIKIYKLTGKQCAHLQRTLTTQ